MHCAFGVNSLHTSNNNAHAITSISGPASRSQFFYASKGAFNESRCLLIEFTEQGLRMFVSLCAAMKLPSRGIDGRSLQLRYLVLRRSFWDPDGHTSTICSDGSDLNSA